MSKATDRNPQWLALEPGDAWFFRDGRPYHAGEANQANVRSEFPPNARTLMGALRAALARANRWDGWSNWNVTKPELTPAIGDGPEDFGDLRLRGPWLSHGGELLLPAPAHLVSYDLKDEAPTSDGQRPTHYGLLRPSDHPVPTDHGDIRLPHLPRDGLGKIKAPSGWVKVSALKDILAGSAASVVPKKRPPAEKPAAECSPDQDLAKSEKQMLFSAKELWQFEPRVGIHRNPQTRAVGDAAVFSPEFVRLAKDVRLVCEFGGVPSDWQPLPGIFPFGGEGRTALGEKITAPAFPENAVEHGGHVLVYLATPMPLSPSTNGGIFHAPRVGEPLFGISGLTLVSACCERPSFIGGWDFTKGGPIAPRPYLPAGSVFFCRADDGFTLPHQPLKLTAADRALGLGHLLFGRWPETAS